jgi:hypothetical protein
MRDFVKRTFVERDAVHVLPGDFLVPNAERCISVYDRLACGPSHVGVEKHRAGRVRYQINFWRLLQASPSKRVPTWVRSDVENEITTPGQLRNALALYPNTRHVVLWTSGDCSDRLALWWVTGHLTRRMHRSRRFWLAESIHDSHPSYPLTAHTPQMISNAFRSIRLLDEMSQAIYREFWRSFASTSPRRLNDLRLKERTSATDRRVAETLLFWGLPRVASGHTSRLMLSELDQMLLSLVGERPWSKSVDVIVALLRNSASKPAFRLYGDGILISRLREWSSSSHRTAALRERLVDPGKDAMNGIVFELTDAGKRLLENGIQSVDQVPPFYVGGCQVYRRRNCWVREDAGNRWNVLHWTK